MREWLVAAGLLCGADGLLLVRNARRNGRSDWSPPGGVVEPGEEVLAGLTREVAEETGLEVTAWQGPVYEVHGEAPDLGWRLRVEVWCATAFTGDLRIDDPDGIVVDARFVELARCETHLIDAHPWVREPLTDWLRAGGAPLTAMPPVREAPVRYGYRIDGVDPATAVVTRVLSP